MSDYLQSNYTKTGLPLPPFLAGEDVRTPVDGISAEPWFYLGESRETIKRAEISALPTYSSRWDLVIQFRFEQYGHPEGERE